jgi:hypothetical protein
MYPQKFVVPRHSSPKNMADPIDAPICSGCGRHRLTPEWNSDAHIFPNALGGRLAPSGLICRECNGRLNDLADNPLIKAFGPWPTLIDVPRQNGKHPAVIVPTTSGQRIRVEPDGTSSLAEVVYDVQEIEGGQAVELGANNWKVVKQLINKAAKDFPQLDPEEARANAREVKIPPVDQWQIRTNFAPANVFPAAFAAWWLFFLRKTKQILLPWPDVLEMLKAVPANRNFRYLPDGLPGLQGPPIPIGHKIILRTVPRTGQLIGYFEVLGALRVGGLIAEGPRNQVLEHIYAADVFEKSDRSSEFSIDAPTFDQTNWNTIGLGLTDETAAIMARLLQAQESLTALWQKREAELTAADQAATEPLAATCFLQRLLVALGWARATPR